MSDASILARDPILQRAIIAVAEFALLTQGEDGWPDVPMVVRFAQAYEVPPGVLGAYFGLLHVVQPDGNTMWLDITRGNPSSPAANGPMLLVEPEDSAAGYRWFVVFRKMIGRPVPTIPLNDYTAELPARPKLRLVGS